MSEWLPVNQNVNDSEGHIFNHEQYPLLIKSVHGKGRCVFATKEYRRGDVILMEHPYAMVIHHYLQATCSTCGHTPTTGQIYGISPDDPQRYCSQQCLTTDSMIHTIEAQALKLSRQLGVDGGIDPCSLLVRIAALRKVEAENQTSSTTLPVLGPLNTFSQIMNLEAASSSLSEDSIRDIQRVAKAMSELINSCNLQLSTDEAFRLLLIIQCNAHKIKDGKYDVALGLFPLTSMLNHSCTPNCFHSYLIDATESHSPPTLVIRALCDIHPGDEICYNYIPLYQSTDTRQAQLFRAYSFTCSCPRCQFNLTQNHISGQDFALDDVISLPVTSSNSGISPFECSTEVLTCHSLLSRSIDSNNKSAIISIIKKLTTLCSNEMKMSMFDPSNEILLTAYQTISRGCEFLLNGRISLHNNYKKREILMENESSESLFHDQKYSMIGIAFTTVALGSILKFTNLRNNETGELEEFIGYCLFHLHEISQKIRKLGISNEANDEILQLFEQFTSESLSKEEFLIILGNLILICLKLSNYYWVFVEGDLRLRNIITLACRYPLEYYHQESRSVYELFILSSKVSKFDSIQNM